MKKMYAILLIGLLIGAVSSVTFAAPDAGQAKVPKTELVYSIGFTAPAMDMQFVQENSVYPQLAADVAVTITESAIACNLEARSVERLCPCLYPLAVNSFRKPASTNFCAYLYRPGAGDPAIKELNLPPEVKRC